MSLSFKFALLSLKTAVQRNGWRGDLHMSKFVVYVCKCVWEEYGKLLQQNEQHSH